MRKARAVEYVGRDEVPACSGVYTAWLTGEPRCFYVGRATDSKTGTLKNRIASHFRGQRGCDQFCLYVHDSYIYPERCTTNEALTTKQVNERTGEWIKKHISFRWLEVPAEEAPSAEAALRRRLRPILNPP